MKPLKPFFTFFGGKWRCGNHYPKPLHDTVIEPFMGAAGYSIRNYDKQVILYDKDPVLYSVWDYLIHADPKRILALPDLGDYPTVDDVPDLTPPERYLIGFWLNKATTRPSKSPSSWMRTRETPDANYWSCVVRERLAAQVPYIRHWKAFNVKYEDISDIKEACWFVDPPYQVAGKSYRCGSADIDYDHLGKWCKSLPGQVIVCENLGADWLDFKFFREIKATEGKRGGKKSKEVVWFKDCEPKEKIDHIDLFED